VTGSKADAGIQNGKVPNIAAVHRKFYQPPLLDGTADGRLVRSERRRFRADCHLFGLRTDLQSEVHTDFLVHLKDNASSRLLTEAWILNADGILTDLEERKRVVSRIGGYGARTNTGVYVCGGYFGVANGRARTIGDRTKNRRGCGLGKARRGEQKQTGETRLV
jgi:hypothetical protein